MATCFLDLGKKNSPLVALSLAQFVIALDYSVIYVALPEIARSMQLTGSHVQWVVSAYGVMFAGFLLMGGRLCDAFGARKIFILAMTLFSLASLLGGMSTGASVLVAARGLQGLGAALLQPAIIALISHYYRLERDRVTALTVWSAVGAAGLVAGVVLGGLFIQLSWRLVFLINLPLGWFCLWSARRSFHGVIPLSPSQNIPLLPSLLATLSVVSMVMAMMSLADHGLNHIETHRWLGVSAIASLCFLLGEKYGNRPLVVRELRRLTSLHRGSIASILYMASLGSELFLLTMLLQGHYGYSAMRTAFMFIPLTLMIIAGNGVAGKLFRLIAPLNVLRGGFIVGAAGLWLMTISLTGQTGWASFTAGLLLSGVGHGMVYTATFVVGMTEVPEALQGAASGLMVTAQYTAGAIALAVLVSILSAYQGISGFYYGFSTLLGLSLLGALLAEEYDQTV
ncbi:MFS transporter [Acerihabitans sp. TG2]|uniref:MFS transporter n=1 Tax=Acerihabitans sp. TG2 TaxID=3096008 RepID=UPI002B23634C|nr:MFS transporter [Acerihabitans sp. TG2]MEA9388960.1 MFS transporter [Acerihabitans sp. TG2]